MPLDATLPTDQMLVAEIPPYIRANRTAINLFESSDAQITISNLSIVGGTTALVVGSGLDLAAIAIEVILLTAAGASTLAQIRGGTEGQIKIFIMQNNNATFTDGVKSVGGMYLNQLPALSNFAAQIDDVLALVNINGDGASDYGYWKELWRQVSVK